MINYSFGINFTLYVNKDVPTVRKMYPKYSLFENNQIFYIIYDSKNEIQELSENIMNHFNFD